MTLKGDVQVSYISVWAFKVINHKETGCGGHRVSENKIEQGGRVMPAGLLLLYN